MHETTVRTHFSVNLKDRRAHVFNVTMTMEAPLPEQKLSLPSWTPGSYMVRDFAQHIINIAAVADEEDIGLEKISKNTFVVASDKAISKLLITYQVYGFDSSIRASFIDNEQAFFNGSSLFLCPHGLEKFPFQLSLTKPQGQDTDSWQVASTMRPVDRDAQGFGTYEAASYDELIDHPFQISRMHRLGFMASSVEHEMVMVGDVRPFDEERLKGDLAKICSSHVDMFGDQAPFSNYLFIARFEEGGYGGLEHRSSSMLLSSPYGLPTSGEKEPGSDYRNFLGLCSHEYFHAWNIKRLKPSNFVDLDLDRECYTTMLWIFEGITSYYDDLCLKRSGVISTTSYLDILSKAYSKLQKNRGRMVQSVADASFDAWIKFYRQNENSLNSTVSYYLKGSFIAMYLDLMIIQKTGGKRSLKDVMRYAFERFSHVGLKEQDFFSLINEIGGLDVDEIKHRYIYGLDEIPLEKALKPFGAELTLSADDTSVDEKSKMSSHLGLKLRFDDNHRATVSYIEQDGPAMSAGLSPSDEIIAIEHIRLDNGNIDKILASLRVGQPINVLYARKKMIKSTELAPAPLQKTNVKFLLKKDIGQDHHHLLEAWVGSTKEQ